MIAKTLEDLQVWQLADELKKEVNKLAKRKSVWQDFKYRSQIMGSCSSTTALIAEGFGRFRPGQFANKVVEARGELDETKDHLLDGVDRGYFTREEIATAFKLYKRTRGASRELLKYLRRTKYEDVADSARRRRRAAFYFTVAGADNY